MCERMLLPRAESALGFRNQRILEYLWAKGPLGINIRGGSVCLNSSGRFVKWISASIMPPPSLASVR